MSSMLELPPPFAESPPAHLRVVGDDRLDFDGAVRRITPHLQRYARRRLGDAHEAEELVQEALLRAYRQGESLRTEDDLTAWCTVVTGRLVIDRLRVRHRSVNVAEVPDGSRVGRDTAEVVVARDEARTALDALDAMPARQAAVLWAREVEGQGYEEIGRRFGMTEPAVRSILTRSRKALRKEYAARGGTLPVAGLAALAPWLGGLRWADRLRAAATRLAAPMAIGAMALGLVGGALHSPLLGDGTATPATARAVVSRPAGGTTDGVGSATAVQASRHLARPVRVAATRDRPPVERTMAERTPVSATCVQAHGQKVAGGDSCLGGGTASRLWVSQPLPDNPTGIRYLGVEGSRIDCALVPTNPVLSCTPGTRGDKP